MMNHLDQKAQKAFQPEAKIGLLATVNDQGAPHITLITSLYARDKKCLMFGQFSHGLSKQHVENNPKTAFLVMTPDTRIWRGNCIWTGKKTEGEDYEMFNNMPMFRYNTYFGIHTVHYMDVKQVLGPKKLPVLSYLRGAAYSTLLGAFPSPKKRQPILTHWGASLCNSLFTLKFLAHVDPVDGFPKIIPLAGIRAINRNHVVVPNTAFKKELGAVSPNSSVAIFVLSFRMESILCRGNISSFSRKNGFQSAIIPIDWAYNSMPPVPGQIFPEVPVKAVENF